MTAPITPLDADQIASRSRVILQVARRFPCLAIRLAHYTHDNFDPDIIYSMMNGWTDGERCLGLFILHLWDSSGVWNFDFMDFMDKTE